MGERYVDVGKVRSRSGALRAGARTPRPPAPARSLSAAPPLAVVEIGSLPRRDRFGVLA